MNKIPLVLLAVALLATSGTCAALSDEEELGKLLYFDTNLSTPVGQSCASCHEPSAGFADPDNGLSVSQGVLPLNRFGNRNSPTAAYAAYSPDFGTITEDDETLYAGGQFWDGRAKDLVEQAKGPFLNPLEMNNPNKRTVIVKIKNSEYADFFEEVTGVDLKDLSDSNVELAYNKVAEAIAAYEGTSEVNQFSSKYDLYLAGDVQLTDEETLGLELFEGKALCSQCHPSEPGPYADQALFTDYTYDNLGTPKNMDNPFYDLPRKFNPEGAGFIDYGLGGFLKSSGTMGWENEAGKVKVPTLRNIAVTSPYMHNGVFGSLTEVVDFYNTRDNVSSNWPAPEVAENVNIDELGDLGLNETEVTALVAFMETLTDGYAAPV
ncbi:cytochrome-c peroxidase [Methanomethylovorans sp.]|uniref:cytochrome-c peroxidase n=1 Tax=Methanomethylovorans sp. TaxID=2758717 RepID=UPI00351C861A